jgi:hypothetical protein
MLLLVLLKLRLVLLLRRATVQQQSLLLVGCWGAGAASDVLSKASQWRTCDKVQVPGTASWVAVCWEHCS